MKIMDTQQKYSDHQQEIEKLRLENVQLKKNLEKEELLHKSLYSQWKQLNARMAAKEHEVEQQFNSSNLFYKYDFYVILILLIPMYYFLSNSKGDKRITTSLQAASSQLPTKNQTPTNNPDTVQLPNVKLKENEIIKPGILQPKMATVNKKVIDKPLTDSARDLIYWQGWNAYYGKSRNPYKKFSQKFEAWLIGWKDGENDAKKLLAKDSTIH